MRLTPAQIAVRLICGQCPGSRHASGDLPKNLRDGHDWLVRMTRKDFGYDLQAWHNHLKQSREGGYTYGRNIALPKIMKTAMESTEWQAAAKRLTERLQKQKRRQS